MIPKSEMDIELLISQYIDGELSSDAEADLHHRLAVSPEARALFRAQLALRGVARDSRVLATPTNDLRSRLFDRLQQEGFAPEAFPSSMAGTTPALPAIERSIPSPRLDNTDRRRRRRAVAWALAPIVLLILFIGREYFVPNDLQKGTPIAEDYGPATSDVRPGELPAAGTGSQPTTTDAGTDTREYAAPPPTEPAEHHEASRPAGNARSPGRREADRTSSTNARRTTTASASEAIGDDSGMAIDADTRHPEVPASAPFAPSATSWSTAESRDTVRLNGADRMDDALNPPPALARHRASRSLSDRLPDDEVRDRDDLNPHILGGNDRSEAESAMADGGGSVADKTEERSLSSGIVANQVGSRAIGSDSTRGEALIGSQEDVSAAAFEQSYQSTDNEPVTIVANGPSNGTEATVHKENPAPTSLDPSMVKAARAACEKASQTMNSSNTKKGRAK